MVECKHILIAGWYSDQTEEILNSINCEDNRVEGNNILILTMNVEEE